MARLTIIPLRKLASGYSAGVPVDVEVGLEVSDWDYNPVKSENVSLGGARETIADRLEEIYQVKTVHIPIASRDLWRMLMASISLGEEFTLDTEGSVASPSAQLGSFKIMGKVNEENLLGRYVRYGFKAVKV
ncbi:MAG: hypothetical protein H6826_13540 [Planctomycetes bacterium]|nr:hypothetical protein [Planctomycetota bacterium]